MWNDLGKYMDYDLHRWNDLSIHCFERGCICQGCFYKQYTYPLKCNMKAAVLELVKKFGKPKEVEKLNSLTVENL